MRSDHWFKVEVGWLSNYYEGSKVMIFMKQRCSVECFNMRDSIYLFYKSVRCRLVKN